MVASHLLMPLRDEMDIDGGNKKGGGHKCNDLLESLILHFHFRQGDVVNCGVILKTLKNSFSPTWNGSF